MRHSDRPWLVVTGGFGRVARVVVPRLAASHRIHVVDRAGKPTTFEPDAVSLGEASDPALLRTAMDGAAAVLHLAADPSPRSPWSSAVGNLDLARSVLDAAAAASVPRIVIASSVHASGGDYRFGATPVRTDTLARPCCEYGVGKAAVEALARLRHDETGASVRLIRFGLTGWDPVSRGLAQTWFGDDDAASLVAACLRAGPGFGVYHGVSRFASAYWDVSNARPDLGWAPMQDLPVSYESLSTRTTANCALFEPPPRAAAR
ncbi:NAD-dependent epimerase/dehydratase family protein [Agromyces sp. SYSU T0242]|uniref:NAD-dependent epimerase/dehydratase family protein n=1 Tax=Agromyces litoreus TaxID=3158561 RepID=UPI003393AF7E